MGAARRYRVKEVAKLARITVRTLHHYDAIGLLSPSRRSDAGYRLYDDGDLARLQQIVIGRELGLSLERIRTMLDDPAFDRRRALREQRELLQRRAEHVDAMLRAVDAALDDLERKGDDVMDPKKLFDGFDPAEHDDEARARWGHTDAYAESKRRTSRYQKKDWEAMKVEADAIVTRLAELLRSGAAADADDAMNAAEDYRLHIDRWFYPCSREHQLRLADLYVGDERFAANYERCEPGLAAFVAAAIRANAARP